MLKEAVVRGPSLVFCQKHEAGKTRICSHKFQDVVLFRKDLGCDANVLYPITMLGDMPCGKEVVVHFVANARKCQKCLQISVARQMILGMPRWP